jgi:hypothetical protein
MPPVNAILERRREGGADKLALRLPAGAVKGAGTALSSAMREEGFLVGLPGSPSGDGAPGRVVAWRFETVSQEGGAAFLLGPGFDGESLDEVSADLPDALSRVLALAAALRELAAVGRLPRGLVSPGLLLSAEAGAGGARDLLVLPPSAVARALLADGVAGDPSIVARRSSPLADGPEADASFLIAQAVYRFAAGDDAFPGGERESVASPGRRGLALALAAPRLDPALATLADRALEDPRRVGLAAWVEALAAARASGWTRELAADEAASLSRSAGAERSRQASRRRRAEFWLKRGSLVAAVAAAALVVAFFAGDMARSKADRPDYTWLTPIEIAQRYYLSLDDLDLDSLELCIEGKQARVDRDYVTNLVVLTKTRMAYEGKSPVVRAADWVAEGEPDLAPTDLLYGIAALSLEGPASPSGDSASLRASYSFWTMERIDAPSGNPSEVTARPAEQKRVDELRLQRGKNGWRIVEIDRRLIQ